MNYLTTRLALVQSCMRDFPLAAGDEIMARVHREWQDEERHLLARLEKERKANAKAR